MRRVVSAMIVGSLMVAGLAAWPAGAQTPPSICQLAPVFLMLRDLIGRERVGDCMSAVVRTETGDLNQPTTRGIMTFRPSDLVVAFGDGQTTWLYGPNGLESRPSSSRLPWETLGAGSQPAALAAPTPVVLSALPITLDGDESATTKPFDLAAGDYVVEWEIERRRGATSCYVGSRLRRFDDQNPGTLVLHTTANTASDRTSAGEARLFAVAAGRYVMDVMTTGCAWKLRIKLPG